MSEAKRFNPSVHLPGMFPHPSGNYVRFPSFERMKQSRDAQRLRADTAEADLLRTSDALIAAEQRIAELVAAFTPLIKNWDDLATGESLNVDRARAALNQKSEGESQ